MQSEMHRTISNIPELPYGQCAPVLTSSNKLPYSIMTLQHKISRCTSMDVIRVGHDKMFLLDLTLIVISPYQACTTNVSSVLMCSGERIKIEHESLSL